MDRTIEITDLINKGLSSREIAKKLNVTSTNVQYWAKKLGLKFRLSVGSNGKRPPRTNFIGKVFGYLTVIDMIQIEGDKTGSYKALCECSNCGNKNFIVNTQALTALSTTSCGCRIDQYSKIRGENSSQFSGYKEITGTYWKRIKNRRETKHSFEVTIEQAYDLFIKQDRKCALSGLPLKFGRSEYFSETTASLDRIDSTKGYTVNNIQWVHKHVNIMKNIFNQDYFIFLCNKISCKHPMDTNLEVPFNQKMHMRKSKVKRMIKVYEGDLFSHFKKEQIDTIVNAANGIGIMGAGIAGAIIKNGGREIQTEALSICRKDNPLPGDTYITNAGNLTHRGVDRIIHAVTMKNPGGPTSYEIIEKAFTSAIEVAIEEGSIKLGCTALGTGVGGLNPKKIADIMFSIAKNYLNEIDIIFFDLNIEFIKRLRDLLTSENCNIENSRASDE